MSLPQTVDPILRLPKIEVLMRAYLLSPMTATPIITKVPNPADLNDTVTAILRTEAGGGSKANRFQYDMMCLLHGYSPDEDQANGIADDAIALASAARGQTINDGTEDWFVVGVMGVGLASRKTDPDVNLPRYIGHVTWRIAGKLWNP